MPASWPVDAHRVTRRALMLGLGTLSAIPLAVATAAADDAIGAVEAMEGRAFARLTDIRRLAMRSDVLLGDLVWTEPASRVTLGLAGGSKIHLGPKAQLTIDRYLAETGGDLVFGDGALVFDRPDDLPKVDLEIRTVYGLIGVRGTRFFAGPSNGRFAVFVERGRVDVFAGGAHRRIRAGEGVDIPARGAVPTPVARWGQPRIDAAFASVLG